MALVALSELKTRVRELTNTDTSTPSQHHITDDFLKRCINRWRNRFYDRLIEKLPKDFAKTADIATIVGQAVYDEGDGFPADFYVEIGLFYDDGSWRRVGQFQHIQDYAALLELEGSAPYPVTHQIQAGTRQLEIRPAPTVANQTMRLVYAPKLVELDLDADTMDGVNGWEDWTVYKSCVDVAIRRKRHEDVAVFSARANEVADSMDQIAMQRSLAEPQTIQDIIGDLNPIRPYFWGVHVP